MTLTVPQQMLLMEISDRPTFVADGYAPAKKLIALGYAVRCPHRDYIEITDAGKAAFQAICAAPPANSE